MLKVLSERLIADKHYSALRCIYFNSLELNLEEGEVSVLGEMVDSIPKQGTRKKKAKKGGSPEEQEAPPAPRTGGGKAGKKRDRASTPATAEVPTPVKPKPKKTRSQMLQQAANVALQDADGDPLQLPPNHSSDSTPS